MTVGVVLYLLVGLVLACIVLGFARARSESRAKTVVAVVQTVFAWPLLFVYVIARKLTHVGMWLAEQDDAPDHTATGGPLWKEPKS